VKIKRILYILAVAFILAVVLRIFVFETVRVASPAMEQSQTIGNRLIIEKWSLGPRMPQSFKNPFSSKNNTEGNNWIQLTQDLIRLPGFSSIQRNNLLVFNDPRSDKNTPVGQRPVLISRCTGLPGEFVQIKGSSLYVNDEEIQRPVDVTQCFRFANSRKKQIEKVIDENIPGKEIYQGCDSGFIFLTSYEYLYLCDKAMNKRLPLYPFISENDVRTALIPYKGYSIQLNNRSLSLWSEILEKYEKVSVKRQNGKILLNGHATEYYTFKQNYYWVLNDHQGYLNDSRTFGPIPECHIIGKACLILYSPEKKRLLQKI